VKFVIIDGYIPDRPNVMSVLFRENEGSALVWALAAFIAYFYDCTKVGVVLDMEIFVLWKFEIGYAHGVRWAERFIEQKFDKDENPTYPMYTQDSVATREVSKDARGGLSRSAGCWDRPHVGCAAGVSAVDPRLSLDTACGATWVSISGQNPVVAKAYGLRPEEAVVVAFGTGAPTAGLAGVSAFLQPC
jgi:hypothetical protein